MDGNKTRQEKKKKKEFMCEFLVATVFRWPDGTYGYAMGTNAPEGTKIIQVYHQDPAERRLERTVNAMVNLLNKNFPR